MPDFISRRSVLAGMAAMTVAATVGSAAMTTPAYAAASADPLPLPPLRIRRPTWASNSSRTPRSSG